MADDDPQQLPYTMRQIDFEVGIRQYDTHMEGAGAITPDWVCVLQLPTPMHVWQIPYADDHRQCFGVRLEEISQIDPLWLGATITLEGVSGDRRAAARRVRMFLGEDPWGIDTYFRDYDGQTVWAVNIRRVPSPIDAKQPDPEQAAIAHVPFPPAEIRVLPAS